MSAAADTRSGLFHGRVVAVTGGSSGIGLATAAAVLAESGSVALLGRDPGRLRAASDELRRGGADSSRILAVAGDGRDEGVIERFLASARQRFGRLDGVAACIGATEPFDLMSGRIERWREIVDANLIPSLLAGRAAARLLEAGGALVLVGSVSPTRAGTTASMPYAVAKGGLPALMRGLAVALGPRGIRVNLVVPGWIDTSMTVADASRTDRIPLGRYGKPGEIGDFIAFVLSPRAGYLAGGELVVDGGESAAFGSDLGTVT